jgi:predicted MPP superfamily phosphohydrolase
VKKVLGSIADATVMAWLHDLFLLLPASRAFPVGRLLCLPPDANGDVMILAGDIITLRDYDPLDQLLQKWKKPILYVTGNHEYYTQRPMNEEDRRFRVWLKAKHPHVKLLLDEEVSIGVSISSAARCGRISTAGTYAPWKPPRIK